MRGLDKRSAINKGDERQRCDRRAENPRSSMFTLSPAPCSLDSWKAPDVPRRKTGETLLIL